MDHNTSPLVSITNHVVVGLEPPGKQANKCGNTWIRGIEQNEVKVQFKFDGGKIGLVKKNVTRGQYQHTIKTTYM